GVDGDAAAAVGKGAAQRKSIAGENEAGAGERNRVEGRAGEGVARGLRRPLKGQIFEIGRNPSRRLVAEPVAGRGPFAVVRRAGPGEGRRGQAIFELFEGERAAPPADRIDLRTEEGAEPAGPREERHGWTL